MDVHETWIPNREWKKIIKWTNFEQSLSPQEAKDVIKKEGK